MNSVTLQLPESSYKRAQRAAMLLNRSIEEETLLDALYHQVGRLTVIKSQAYALLHQRGHAVPQP